MKIRLLVMNGQRLVQAEQEGEWQTGKVEKAGLVKPGIYNLYLADQADKSQAYDGAILHADSDSVYQQVGKKFIRHERADFDRVPERGTASSVRYEQGKAKVDETPVVKLSRSQSR